MMQTIEPRYRNDPAGANTAAYRLTTCRSLLVQPEMSPVLMVVAGVLFHETLEMAFVEHDDMIEQIFAAAADEAFR